MGYKDRAQNRVWSQTWYQRNKDRLREKRRIRSRQARLDVVPVEHRMVEEWADAAFREYGAPPAKQEGYTLLDFLLETETEFSEDTPEYLAIHVK